MASIHCITLDQGTDKQLKFKVWADAAHTQPFSLVGASAVFKFSKRQQDAAIATINAVVDTVNSVCTVNVSDAVTSALRFPGDTFDGWYQVDLTLSDGTNLRVAHGDCTILKSI